MTAENLRRFLRKTVELLFSFKMGMGPPGAGEFSGAGWREGTMVLHGLVPLEPFGVEGWWGRASRYPSPVTGRAMWAWRGASQRRVSKKRGQEAG